MEVNEFDLLLHSKLRLVLPTTTINQSVTIENKNFSTAKPNQSYR